MTPSLRAWTSSCCSGGYWGDPLGCLEKDVVHIGLSCTCVANLAPLGPAAQHWACRWFDGYAVGPRRVSRPEHDHSQAQSVAVQPCGKT
jgi:hypothetical protein